jgi:hypothetical protein
VYIRWVDEEDIKTYPQGDARYEVDRGRWRILGAVQDSPLGSNDLIAGAIKKLRQEVQQSPQAERLDKEPPECEHKPMPRDAATPPTEESTMTEKISKAAREREQAQKAVANGIQERDTYTAKQVATRCGTDAKTMRKFFRSKASTVEPVGQGGRYEFASDDLPKIKREFDAWQKRSSGKQTKPAPRVEGAVAGMAKAIQQHVDEDSDIPLDRVAEAIERAQEQEPTEEELKELEELDLDDLDAEDLD